MTQTPENKGESAAQSTSKSASQAAPWGDLFRDGRAIYSSIVMLGVIVHALQILVVVIIMPTVVADVGGADFYTWPSMLYTVGAIVGTASVGPLWAACGRRGGTVISAAIFLVATIACALAPNMFALCAARLVQGYGGGLIFGGGMALIAGLFHETLRRRIIAAQQGIWMIAQLLGPALGGGFAELGWWRGSFWSMVPLALIFMALVWFRVPEEEPSGEPPRTQAIPFLRLSLLAAGVFAIGLSGPVHDLAPRIALFVLAAALVWLTLRLDSRSANRLYPTAAFSPRSPVGLGLLVLFTGGMAQTSVNLFMPLLLQVVHGVTPLFISFIAIIISFGWTLGTFAVSGWSGRREDWALRAGPILMFVGIGTMALIAAKPMLGFLAIAAFVLGIGVGIHNVHIVARTIGHARKGEERITSAAVPSMRSLGTAFGAAVAGGISTMAGLGDATEPENVGRAVTLVYAFNLLPLVLAVVFVTMLVRMGRRSAA
jgi:MFS family permease